MHYPTLPYQSPKHVHHRSLIKIKSSEAPIYHMTMKQVASFQQYYDDIKYQLTLIQKFIVIGRIKQVCKGISQRNIPLLKIKVADNTREWRQNKQFIVYDTKMEEKLLYAIKNNLYVEIGCHVKVTGLVYKTQIQVTASSFRLVSDFNIITQHLLACMKTGLITV